jgi:S1-C subfamily serine protease
VAPVDMRSDHGFLGIQYYFHNGAAEVDKVLPGTPADSIHLRHGDRVVRVNGVRMTSLNDLQERIFNASPGSTPTLTVERNGAELMLRPTLIAWPSSLTY